MFISFALELSKLLVKTKKLKLKRTNWMKFHSKNKKLKKKTTLI